MAAKEDWGAVAAHYLYLVRVQLEWGQRFNRDQIAERRCAVEAGCLMLDCAWRAMLALLASTSRTGTQPRTLDELDARVGHCTDASARLRIWLTGSGLAGQILESEAPFPHRLYRHAGEGKLFTDSQRPALISSSEDPLARLLNAHADLRDQLLLLRALDGEH